MKPEEYIGYYLWEHEPCRIIRDEQTGDIVAQMYCKGQGYVPLLLTDVMWHGKEISEKKFKQKVMKRIDVRVS